MIRTYYLSVEGDRDEILEHHGQIMKHLRSLPGRKLSATISFDERNMRKELAKGAVVVVSEGAKSISAALKEGWKKL